MNLKEFRDAAERPPALEDLVRINRIAREWRPPAHAPEPEQPKPGTWCRCGSGVPMCGTHKSAPWILADGTWYCSRACVP